MMLIGVNNNNMSYRERHNRSRSPDRRRYENNSESGVRVFVGGLRDPSITKADIEDKFGQYGPITDISIHRNFAFLQYQSEEGARKAIQAEHEKMFRGFRLEVEYAKRKGGGGGGGGGGPGGPPGNRNDGGNRDRHTRWDRERNQERRGRSPNTQVWGDRPRNDPNLHPNFNQNAFDNYGNNFPGNNFIGNVERPNPAVFNNNFSGNFPEMAAQRPNMIEPSVGGNDCEIIVVNKAQRSYAEEVERQLKSVGLMVDLLFPTENASLSVVMADIVTRGCKYAMIITRQNEDRKTVDLHMLHERREVSEQRNVPLDNAINLVARDFSFSRNMGSEMLSNNEVGMGDRGGILPAPLDIRGGGSDRVRGALLPDPVSNSPRHISPGKPQELDKVPEDISLLLSLVLHKRTVTINDIDKIINYFKDRREKLLSDMGPGPGPGPGSGSDKSQLTASKPPDKSIAQQQAELQQRILSILNSGNNPNAGASQSSVWVQGGAPPPPPPAAPAPVASTKPQSAGNINFNNPNVQKALENLMQSGTSLIKTLGNNPNVQDTKSVGLGAIGYPSTPNNYMGTNPNTPYQAGNGYSSQGLLGQMPSNNYYAAGFNMHRKF